jgi:glutamate dehydrogenase (NADP+)
MSFCQSFMSEFYKYIGPNEDVPAGDIGVGGREIGYLFGQYKKLTNQYEGTITGKGLRYGGSLVRTEATGYGLVYITEEMLNNAGKTVEGSVVAVSGSGNVAIYAAEKASLMGAKVVTMSDSDGYIYDANGIDLETIKEIKEVKRGRISEYADRIPSAEYHGGKKVWEVKCDIALPCAIQYELDLEDAQKLVANGCIAVAEGANMPATEEAAAYLQSKGILFMPGKASNAGGVAVSALEMSQNSMRIKRSFEEVDEQLREIMKDIWTQVSSAAADYDKAGDYISGANIAGFRRVVKSMRDQGWV